MLPAEVAGQLRRRGHDVGAVVERGDLRGLSDLDLFERAQGEGRAVVTYNREDFLALDRQYRHEGNDHCGVVIVHPRRFPQREASVGALVRSIESLLTTVRPYQSFVHWLQ